VGGSLPCEMGNPLLWIFVWWNCSIAAFWSSAPTAFSVGLADLLLSNIAHLAKRALLSINHGGTLFEKV